MKKLILILGLALLLNLSLVYAHGSVAQGSDFTEGHQLVESEVSCDGLTNEQLEEIGEYYMEQMHPGEAHDAIHQMMGVEEGTEYHMQVHADLAKMMYCGTGGMMGSEGMMSRSMLGGKLSSSHANKYANMMQSKLGMKMGMLGLGSGYLNFLHVLYVILLIGLIVLVYMWIAKLWRNMDNKKSSKNSRRNK